MPIKNKHTKRGRQCSQNHAQKGAYTEMTHRTGLVSYWMRAGCAADYCSSTVQPHHARQKTL